MKGIFYLLTWGSVLAGASGAAGAWFHVTSPVAGMALCLIGVALSVLAVLAGLLALFVSNGKIFILFFWLLHAGAVGGGVYLLLPAQEHPISDVTTDTKNPPPFLTKLYAATIDHGVELLQDVPVVDRSYKRENALKQAGLYPDIRPIKIRTKEAKPVFELLLKRLPSELSDWRTVSGDSEKLVIEGLMETGFFRYLSDVSIRLTAPSNKDPDPGVMVDIRSRGRMDYTDFGFNAARVRDVIRAIRDITSSLVVEENKVKKPALPATGTTVSLPGAPKAATGTAAPLKKPGGNAP